MGWEGSSELMFNPKGENTFGKVLAALMTDRDWEAGNLATKTGVSYHSIRAYGKGTQHPGKVNIRKLAVGLSRTEDEIPLLEDRLLLAAGYLPEAAQQRQSERDTDAEELLALYKSLDMSARPKVKRIVREAVELYGARASGTPGSMISVPDTVSEDTEWVSYWQELRGVAAGLTKEGLRELVAEIREKAASTSELRRRGRHAVVPPIPRSVAM